MADAPTASKSTPARSPGTSPATQQKGLAVRGPDGPLAAAEVTERSTQVLLEFESPSAHQLALPVPLRSRHTTYIIFTMFFLLFLVAVLFPIDRVIVGTGVVVTVEQQVGLSALETGIVRSIRVRLGQVVRKGDVLLTLDPTTATANLAAIEEQVASLTQETRRLQAELDGRTFLTDGTRQGDLQALIYTQRYADITFQMENYSQKIEALRGPVRQAMTDIVAYTKRLELARTTYDKRRELQRLQVGSELQTMAAADILAEATRSLEAAKSQLPQSQNSLDAMIAERDSTIERWRGVTSQSLSDQRGKLDQAQADLQKARLSASMIEMRAPMDATVLNVAQTNTGTVVIAASQLILLTPLDSPLEYEVVFAASDAGYVFPGQRATIKFDTFPFISHGTGSGKLRVIGPDSTRAPYDAITQPASLSASQQASGQRFYTGRVTMEALNLVAVPGGFRVTPGMAVTVDVLAGHRTFVEYLFSRVVPAATEGFREP